jgi:hypothetical protein
MHRIFITVVAGLLFIPSFSFSTSAFADQYVHGYYRGNGTYVQPYYRSSPNGTVTDNFSYKGNINPHTGKVGTNRYIHDRTSPYYEGPDSHGRIGHDSARYQPEAYHDPNYSVSLCAGSHFRMTEHNGCQAVH